SLGHVSAACATQSVRARIYWYQGHRGKALREIEGCLRLWDLHYSLTLLIHDLHAVAGIAADLDPIEPRCRESAMYLLAAADALHDRRIPVARHWQREP